MMLRLARGRYAGRVCTLYNASMLGVALAYRRGVMEIIKNKKCISRRC